MRKLVVSEFISLDGVIEEPQWTFPYWGDDIATFKFSELFFSDSLLLGRTTYEGFAQAWPGREDSQGYADRMNNMPKHLVSTTLTNPTWTNTTVISANVVDEIKKLKEGDGQQILVFGSGKLAKTLIENDLVDYYNLLVYPIVLGKGQRLFADLEKTPLKLSRTSTFASGVMGQIYEPDRSKK